MPNFSAIRPAVSEIQERGTSASALVQMYPPMAYVICIPTWSLSTHQILSLSAYPFLSYSLVANSYSPHFARATCYTGYPYGWVLVSFTVRDAAIHQGRPFVNRTRSCRDISKSVTGSCRAAHTQICPLFTKELQS